MDVENMLSLDTINSTILITFSFNSHYYLLFNQMKSATMSVIYLVFLDLLAIAAINISFCNGSTPVGWIESERPAILRF